jgi:hypothetical protein
MLRGYKWVLLGARREWTICADSMANFGRVRIICSIIFLEICRKLWTGHALLALPVTRIALLKVIFMINVPKEQQTVLTLLLFFFCLLLLLTIPIRTPLNAYDESVAVVNAIGVLNGEVPYRDYWVIYPPGQLYAMAGVYKLLGVSLLSSRIYDTLIQFLIVIGFYLAARKIASKGLAHAVALGVALVMAAAGFYSYAVYPALACGVFSLWSTLKYAETDKFHWLYLAGALIGGASSFRWDIGLYGFLGLGAAVFLHRFAAHRQSGQGVPQSARSGMSVTARLLLPALVLSSFVYGLVSLNSGLGYVWDQVFVFPMTKLHDVRGLPYPALIPEISSMSNFWHYHSRLLNWLRFYLPLAIYLLALLVCADAFLKKRIQPALPLFGVYAPAFFGLLAFAQAMSRYDNIHALPTGLFAFLTIVGLANLIRPAPFGKVLKISLIALLPAVLSVYFLSTMDSVNRVFEQFPPWGCYSPSPLSSCTYVPQNRKRAVEYIQSKTQARDPIYVGNLRHDKVFANDVSFYYLAGRPSATRYSTLHPGVTDTREVQAEIIKSLESKQVNYLILVNYWLSNEPNKSAISSGVTDLDVYIRSQYRAEAQFGEYIIVKRVVR